MERERARELRAESWTLAEIGAELGVAKSSVSVWVRDVDFTPRPRSTARRRGPNVLQRRKAAEIEQLREEGRRRIGLLSEREFLVAGAALYAGEGSRRDGMVAFVNSDPRMVLFFCQWLRRFFEIDEYRLRARLHLHEDLDLVAATRFWSDLLAIPVSGFGGSVPVNTGRSLPVGQASDGVSHRPLQLQSDASGRDGPHRGAARFLLSFRGSSAGRAPHC